jgi:hypothetical protein
VKQAPAGVAFGVTAGILVAVTVAFTFTFGVSYGNGPNIEYRSWAQGRPLGVEAGIWLGGAGWLMLGLVTGLTKWTETPSRAN